MEKGRLVYIEPNDIVKDHIKLYNSSHKNFTWNPEDLNLYVDLQVVCPSRNDCGTEPEVKNGTYSNTYISLMEGEKIGKRNSLTTDYTNISYSEIKNNNVSSKEALGITSIDITFDAHFYPKVTINFTDVRAYSLFMPAEEEYKEGLKTKAFEAGKYHETGRAYTNFFNAVFHFPYPRFLLTVKGFYGTKVTFILAVETFKSALNSNTGNFDVTINFIGYMYGIYTDIPMNFLMCAPYISKMDYNESDVLMKGEYWNRKVNEGVFITKDGQQLPTFLEFAKRYAIALNNINGNIGTVGEYTAEINNIKYLLAKIDEISKKIENLVLNNFGTDPNDVNKHIYSKSIGTNNKKYHFFIFEKNDNNNGIEAKWDKTLSKEINELINDTNRKYADLLKKHNGTITYPMLCSNPDVFKAKVIGKVKDFIKVKDENGQKIVEKQQNNGITIEIDNTPYSYNTDNDDTNTLINYVKDRVIQGGGTKIENLYFCAINLYETLSKLNELKNKLEKEKNDTEGSASIEAENYISEQLGFKPSIENIFRMVFAHLDCFFHEYLEECIYKIKDSERKINDDTFIPKLNSENTDVKYKDKDGNVFLPPFFAYYIFNSQNGQGQQKELAYPGIYNIEEVAFVNRLINSAKQYNKEYNDIVQEIDELSTATSNYNNEEHDISNFELPISFNDGFSPSSYYDIFYGDKNPYSNLNSDSALLIKDIFYTFALRYYSLMMLGVSNSSLKVLENEVNNVIACFPNINQEKFEEIFDKGHDGSTLYTYVNDYSKKRIVQIDKLNIPKTEKTNKLLLLTSIDTSTTYSDEEREVVLNDIYKNTFAFLRGIKILDIYNYGEFEKLKSKLSEQNLEDNRTLFDNTKYIIENEDASRRPIHKLYKTKPVSASVKATSFTDENVDQLPTDNNYGECTLPFILWSWDKNGAREIRNLLYDLSKNIKFTFLNKTELDLQTLSNEAKAFFILSSLIVSIKDIRDSFQSTISGSANDLFGRKITKTRKIIPLFYGCILYIFRKKFKEGIDLVPNLITIDSKNNTFNVNFCITENRDRLFKLDYQMFDVKNNENNKVMVNLIKQLLCVHSEEIQNKYITSEDINITNNEISDIFDNLNGLTDVEKYFLKEIKEGGIFQEILNAAKEEVDSGFSNIIHLEHSAFGTIDFKSSNKVYIYPISGKTNNAIVRLMSETVCMVSTTYEYSKPKIINGVINNGQYESTTTRYIEKSFKEILEQRLQEFYNKLYASYQHSKNKTEETYELLDDKLNSDIKRSLYYTLKSLYDKWICSYGNMERFRLNKIEDDVRSKNNRFKNGTYVNNKTEINNFLFVDSLYRDIGQTFTCDPSSVIRLSQTSFDGKNNFSVYQFLHALCQENKLLMRAIPVYNNFYTEGGLKEIFTPKDVFNTNQAQENGFSSTYLIMYTHQPSTHLNKESSEYQDDGMYIGNDISRTIKTTDFEKIFLDKGDGYVVPTFGVTYGMQNQSYFKGININMDNPITTDYSIANQLMISQTAASGGDLNLPLGIGQNIYSIYSNRSYNCTVEMMGCANIMPMMYFQLNNIPMFKGVYMITSVKHSIRSGNMTTIFTGVRQTSIIYPFVNSNLILTTILDRSNGPSLHKVNKKEVETIENNDGSTRINNNSNSVTKIMKPEYYTDITITNGSLLDETWMKNRRDYWREQKDGKYRHLTNAYWGQPHKGMNYPLNKRKVSDIAFIILHFADTPDSTFDKGKNNFRALNMRNGWFSSWLKPSVEKKPSADFGIDDTHIVQFTPDYTSYAGLSCDGNKIGISIEMCNTFSGTPAEYGIHIPNRPQYGFSEKVLENTKKLIIEIFLQIGPKNITTHYRRGIATNTKDPKECPGIWGWNNAIKKDKNGKTIKEYGVTVLNDETKLDEFIESVWEEWVKVAQEKGREIGTKIKKVF